MRKSKTTVRRIICIALAAIMLCSAMASTAAAATKCGCGHSPVIMISGFGATTLAERQEDGSLKSVFPPDIPKTLLNVGINAGGLIGGILNLLGKYDKGDIKKPLQNIVAPIVEPLRMNPDGTSYYDIVPIISGAENTSLEAFTKNNQLDYVPYTGSEFLDMEVIGDEIGDDHVFNFLFDWRLSHAEAARQLREYIKEVCALTGHSKVSIYSISQGCLVLGTYMYEYPSDNYIDRAVFDTPLFEGSNLISDLYSTDPLALNYDVALKLISDILHTELSLMFLTDIIPEDGANIVADYIAKGIIIPAVVNIPAFWEMCPADKFKELSDVYLDETENAELLKTIAKVKNGFMSHIAETLQAQQKKGVSVSIKACSGSTLASGTDENSDGIVNLKYSCGAVCAPWGKTLPDGYVQKVNTGKNNISPDRTVDLSTGYLPERTWVVNRHFHGQAEWDPRSYDLLMKLLLTDDIKDAYSHFEYPQFMESLAPTSDIAVIFKSTGSSFLPTLSGKLFSCNSVVVTNLSKTDKLCVKSIKSENGTLKFNLTAPLTLKPGESVQVSFNGTVPQGEKYDSIKVSYRRMSLTGEQTEKVFGITITDNYSGVIKRDLTPAVIITAVQTAERAAKVLAEINSVIAVIKGIA